MIFIRSDFEYDIICIRSWSYFPSAAVDLSVSNADWTLDIEVYRGKAKSQYIGSDCSTTC